MRKSSRLEALCQGIFGEMNARAQNARDRGIDLIDLSIGSPDLPPAPHIRSRLSEMAAAAGSYRYTVTSLPSLHRAAASWYLKRFGVQLDPKAEVVGLLGSQDGLAHLFLALLDPGDVALVPDPGYPIYSAGPVLAGAQLHRMPLLGENDFLPQLDKIPSEIAGKARVMLLNYPSNPLAAIASREFFEEVVAFAKAHDIVVVHDAAYSELCFDGYRPPSFLEAPGAIEVGIEFNSLSKAFNMAGCRAGYAVGNSDVIAALAEIKSHVDFGIFLPIQEAAVAALTGPQDCVQEMALTYQRRRDVLVKGLRKAGWNLPSPKATMFVWAPVPLPMKSRDFALELLENTGVMVTFGSAFGEWGEGYVRIALVEPEEVLQEAASRIARWGILRG
ncbi:MAG: aminotransferase class I/II-fold pyridoxal phosphate-dependent enzyme [Bacillota bacterium]